MNQINFKLSKLNISTLKEISKLEVIPQNLIIKTDKEKNIIFVFTNLRIELNLKKYTKPETEIVKITIPKTFTLDEINKLSNFKVSIPL